MPAWWCRKSNATKSKKETHDQTTILELNPKKSPNNSDNSERAVLAHPLPRPTDFWFVAVDRSTSSVSSSRSDTDDPPIHPNHLQPGIFRSNLVPTLQKIWANHGNIIEGCSVHSKDMLACILESLAKVIIILQSSSGRTLTKSQCDYAYSILLDLLQARLKVEWLVPFVEKARVLHQRKPLIDGLAEIDESVARAAEMKVKCLKELARLEKTQRTKGK